MKKFILTERQAKGLVDDIIKEQIPAMRATEYSLNDGRYRKRLRCRFSNIYDLSYKGYKVTGFAENIYNVDYTYVDVSYLIDIVHETYGIKDIIINDIKGPTAIKIDVEYLKDNNITPTKAEDEDIIREKITLQLNWNKVKAIKEFDMEYFGLADDLEITIVNDNQGGVTIKTMEVGIRKMN
jgi:hypothetical protein